MALTVHCPNPPQDCPWKKESGKSRSRKRFEVKAGRRWSKATNRGRAFRARSGSLKQEDLGTQTINGVMATGTRYTHTIPAGQIGNEKPIVAVSERWYSNDLQIVVKSTRNDPRFGTSTYTVTNIQRTEPASALFTVPADYTVQAGGRGHRGRGVVPPPPPPSDN